MTATISELSLINRSDTNQPCWTSNNPNHLWWPLSLRLTPCTIASVFITFSESVKPSADKWIMVMKINVMHRVHWTFCFDTDDKVQPFILSSVLNPTHKPQLGFWQIQGFPTQQQIVFLDLRHSCCLHGLYNSEGGSGGRTRHIFHSQVCMTLAREDLENGWNYKTTTLPCSTFHPLVERLNCM